MRRRVASVSRGILTYVLIVINATLLPIVQLYRDCKSAPVLSDHPHTEPLGLRQRKKQATRQALSRAALGLAIENGPDDITVEDISAAAGVSYRTFFNYFSSKEEALVGNGPPSPSPDALRQFIAADANLWTALHELMRSVAAQISTARDDVVLRHQLLQRYPALLPRHIAGIAALELDLAEAIAQRCQDTPTDAGPQVSAALAITVLRVALCRWVSAGSQHDLTHYLDECFTHIPSSTDRRTR